MNFKAYVAGSISHLTAKQIYEKFNPIISQLKSYDYVVLHPLIFGEEINIKSSAKIKPTGYDPSGKITKRCKWMVEQCDILFADLTKAKKISVGTMFEIAWAKIWNKNIIIIMEKNNIHQHLFVQESATEIFETLEEGFAYLRKFSKIFN